VRDNPIPFIVSAADIVTFQACRRRYLYSRKWRALRWLPKLLLDACLRQGIIDLGQGKPLADVISSATTRFYGAASSPGLDLPPGIDPYKLAIDHIACLETLLTTLSRRPLATTIPVKSKVLFSEAEWAFTSYQDANGELHRTITVSDYGEDTLTREMHSWYVVGDICVAKKPMHLHFIEIGQIRDGRRHTPWCKAMEHAFIAKRIKFQNKGAKPLQGNWKSVWLSESSVWKAEDWCDVLFHEDVPDTLMHDVVIEVPSKERVADTLQQILIEARSMQEWEQAVQNPNLVPMTRAACDFPYTCSFVPCCYGPQVDVDVAGLGIYKPRLPTTIVP